MVANYFNSHTTIRHGNTFLLMTYPTVYQYNAAEEEWKTLPKNMSKPFSDIPILVDLDMFPVCAEDIA